MSLLSEIQQEAANSAIDISTVLRKAKILAAHLKNQQFADWLERELNGYPVNVDVPGYRVARGMARGEYALTFQRQATLPIPDSVLPERLRHWAERAQLREPIAAYSSLLARSPTAGCEIQFPWPTDMARFYGSRAYKEAQCLHAWISVDPSVLAALLDSVRNRLLSFALAIEAENPGAGEADIRSTPVEPTIVSQYFQTFIYGPTNNIAVGGTDFSQRHESLIQPGDFQALRDCLEASGADSREIQELESELTSARTPEEREQAADGWLGRTARKAIGAARAFAVEVCAKAIAEYLRPPGP